MNNKGKTMGIFAVLAPCMILSGCGSNNLGENVDHLSFRQSYEIEAQFDTERPAEQYDAEYAQTKAMMTHYTDSNGNRYYISNNKSEKKVILFPGLGGGEDNYLIFPFNSITKGLIEKGYQVISTNLKINDDRQLPLIVEDDGNKYNLQFEQQLKDKLAFIKETVGDWTELSYGGVSFGGYHAMLATCLNPVNTSYFSLVTVVRPELLLNHSELKSNILISSDHCKSILEKKNGYLMYGTKDDRVRWELTENLANSFNDKSKTSVIKINNLDHRTTTPSVVFFLNIFN